MKGTIALIVDLNIFPINNMIDHILSNLSFTTFSKNLTYLIPQGILSSSPGIHIELKLSFNSLLVLFILVQRTEITLSIFQEGKGFNLLLNIRELHLLTINLSELTLTQGPTKFTYLIHSDDILKHTIQSYVTRDGSHSFRYKERGIFDLTKSSLLFLRQTLLLFQVVLEGHTLTTGSIIAFKVVEVPYSQITTTISFPCLPTKNTHNNQGLTKLFDIVLVLLRQLLDLFRDRKTTYISILSLEVIKDSLLLDIVQIPGLTSILTSHQLTLLNTTLSPVLNSIQDTYKRKMTIRGHHLTDLSPTNPVRYTFNTTMMCRIIQSTFPSNDRLKDFPALIFGYNMTKINSLINSLIHGNLSFYKGSTGANSLTIFTNLSYRMSHTIQSIDPLDLFSSIPANLIDYF